MSETRRVIEQPDGVRLHRWTTRNGVPWACAAYDHGPFCRLCQTVDDALAACLENVDDGLFTVSADSTGQLQFKVTEAGMRRVKHMIEQMGEDCPHG